ncbi:MAG: DUF4215 domain-containing protein [Nannocystaceae bacterium]
MTSPSENSLEDPSTGDPSGASTDDATSTDPTTEPAGSDSDSVELTSDTDTDTDTGGPVCGDGRVEGDEECDDGNDDNDDACVAGCRDAFCGDGFVRAGAEECDDGDDDPHDGCDLDCVRDRVVFVSSMSYSTDLGNLGGADTKCQLRAQDAGLANAHRFRAWIATEDGSPATRMEGSPGRYVLVTGIPIAQSWDDLTDGELENPINLTEHGELLEVTVYTNTTITGEVHPEPLDCDHWTSIGDGWHRYGVSLATDYNWVELDFGSPDACGAGGSHLYCFED